MIIQRRWWGGLYFMFCLESFQETDHLFRCCWVRIPRTRICHDNGQTHLGSWTRKSAEVSTKGSSFCFHTSTTTSTTTTDTSTTTLVTLTWDSVLFKCSQDLDCQSDWATESHHQTLATIYLDQISIEFNYILTYQLNLCLVFYKHN